MKLPASNLLVRSLFLLASICIGVVAAYGSGVSGPWVVLGGVGGAVFAAIMFLVDISLRNLSIRRFSFGTVGLMIGLLCGWLVTQIPIFEPDWLENFSNFEETQVATQLMNLAIYLGFGFIGTMLALRSKREEFSLLIPYVRFRQDSLHEVPILLDSNIIIDGRIAQLCETGFIGGALIVPQFVLDELQRLADSKNDAKREPGKRGLEYLKDLQTDPDYDISIYDDPVAEEKTVDAKLTALGSQLNARILTNDTNLAKVARLKGVTVLSLHELATALKKNLSTGDQLEVHLVKEGKDAKQAVGYLSDGSMIVVNRAAEHIGTRQTVVVSSTTQTASGQLIFADIKG